MCVCVLVAGLFEDKERVSLGICLTHSRLCKYIYFLSYGACTVLHLNITGINGSHYEEETVKILLRVVQ